MTKKNFLELISKKRKVEGKETTKEIVDLVFSELTNLIKNGESLNVIGLGTFSSVEKEEREMFVPMTKETVTIPKHSAPRFKYSKGLKDSMKLK